MRQRTHGRCVMKNGKAKSLGLKARLREAHLQEAREVVGVSHFDGGNGVETDDHFAGANGIGAVTLDGDGALTNQKSHERDGFLKRRDDDAILRQLGRPVFKK